MRSGHHRSRRSVGLQAACLTGLLLLLALAVFGVTKWMQGPEPPEATGDYRQRLNYEALIEVDGVTYRPKRRLTTILLIGVDREKEPVTTVSYRNGGQADFLRLLVIDDSRKCVSQIQIDRDTMTPITTIGVMGNRSGVRTAQIALSHAFGDGQAQSCQLTVEAVSKLLLGVNIDFYAAMNMDGIPVLNDAVGGVTVTIQDDFSESDPAMVPGATLKLTGEQARLFVRGRQSVSDGTNVNRMARQQVFMRALADEIQRQQSKDSSFFEKLYDTLTPHAVTNLTKARLINEAWFASDYEQPAPYSLEGEHRIGATGFMQFFPDEEALRKLVLELFYEEVR